MILIHEVQQGTPEWFNLRLGVATASCADRIITPTGKPSAQAAEYAAELAAEVLGIMGDEDVFQGNQWTERGNRLEDEAVALYELLHDVDLVRPGFCVNVDCPDMGVSPDAARLEIKCPKLTTHLSYLYAGVCPPKYVPQVQFHMMVTGHESCDFMSYHPSAKPLIVTVARDQEFIDKLFDLTLAVIEQRDRIIELAS